MSSTRLARTQLKALSDCLHEIYSTPAGENPTLGVLSAVEGLVRVNSLAVDEFTAKDGRIVGHQHVTSRGFEGHPEVAVIPRLVAGDHPMIQHSIRTRRPETLRLSDFVSERQMRALSIYDFNHRILGEWRDQISVTARTASGTISFALNRDRPFTDDEFFLLDLLRPHIQRVLNRCALFKRLPGNEQLTAREREVLYWIMQGKRDEEIATILHASPRTVQKHVVAILSKLGVENRASAIAIMLRDLPAEPSNVGA